MRLKNRVLLRSLRTIEAGSLQFVTNVFDYRGYWWQGQNWYFIIMIISLGYR